MFGRGRRPRAGIAGRVLVGASVAVAALALTASPALAAGNTTLENHIVSDPVPGWKLDTGPAAGAYVSIVSSVENSLVPGTTAAAERWVSPDGQSSLLVSLIRFPRVIPTAANVDGAVRSVCNQSGGAGDPFPFAGVSGSAEDQCLSPSTANSVVRSISWVRTNVLVSVIGYGSMSQSQVESAASQENALVPSGGIAVGGVSVGLIAGIAVAVVLVAALIVLLVVRRQKETAAAAAAAAAYPGWPAPAPGGMQPTQPWNPPPAPAGGQQPWNPPPAPDGGQAVGTWNPPAAPQTAVPTTSVLPQAAPVHEPVVAAISPDPPPAEAGWYPVGDSQYEQRYSDGTSWVAHKRWSGTEWVDVAG